MTPSPDDIRYARCFVTAILMDDEFAFRTLMADLGDDAPRIVEILAGMVAGLVTLSSEMIGEDPHEAWRVGIARVIEGDRGA